MGDIRDSGAGRTATYLLRFTPEEKAALEEKTRICAVVLGEALTMADVLRRGAECYLDGILHSDDLEEAVLLARGYTRVEKPDERA